MPATDSPPGRCPSCGTKLPAGVPAERCPPCLLRLALAPAGDPPLDDETESANALPEAPGVFGEYELVELIGRGAMGAVFKARQTSLDRLVALKVLDLAGQGPADAARRFRAEASAAAGLRHPCIVAIHDVGVYRDRHYLAMDLIDGPTLATLVSTRPMPAMQAARLLASVADAIQCAHEHGILHRDLKPSNILVDASGQPHVADFGLAKRMHADADVTMPGQIMGSPNYMSPEQACGAVVGVASDVHALGAVLYHCLAGRPPFFGQTVADTLHHVIHGEPVALRLLVAGVPRDLETIVLKCLEKDPARRYPDARSLASELRRFLRHEPIQARAVGRPERVWRWCRRRPAFATLAAVTALLMLAVALGSPVALLRIRAERERAEDNLYAADMNLAQQALARSSRSQVRALLERHRPAPGGTDRRGFEWRYLWTHTVSDEREVLKTSVSSRHLVVLPGRTLVAAGNGVWDLEAPARPVFRLPPEQIAMALDATTGTLFAGGSHGLSTWSTATWATEKLLAGETVCVVTFSKDGQWMATGGARLRLWAREGGSWRPVASRERAFKDWHNARTLAFAPDGATLVSGTGESWGNRCELEFWSVPTLEARPGLMAVPRDIVSLAFSPDGTRLVAGCWNGRIRIWDLETREEVKSEMRHHGFVSDVMFSPRDSNVLASTASDRMVRLWRLSTGELLTALQGPFDQLWALAFVDGGQTLLTLEQGGRVARWDPGVRRNEETLVAEGPRVQLLGFSADGEMLATFDETGALRFWDVKRRREHEARRRTFDLTGVSTRDFEIIAPMLSLNFGWFATGMVDGRVQLWDLQTRTANTWKAHERNVRNVAFSPDSAKLATIADDGVLKVWDVTTRELRMQTTIPDRLAGEDFNVPLVWSADGSFFALATETRILLYDGEMGREVRKLDPEGLVYSMRFSPDGRMLVSGQDDFDVTFWDPRSGALLARVASSHQEGVYDFAFSPDGRTLASVVDQVKLWSLATKQEVSTLLGHERNIFSALFSPDGNLLVTADYGGAVRLWSARPFEAIDPDRR